MRSLLGIFLCFVVVVRAGKSSGAVVVDFKYELCRGRHQNFAFG
jgi:hypothetical protein